MAQSEGAVPLPGDAARNLTPFRRLRALFRPDRSDIVSVAIFSVIAGALLLAQPVAVQALVNFVAFGANIPSLVILTLLLALGLLLGALVLALQTWTVEVLQRRMFIRLVGDLGERLPRLSWSVRDHYYEPELVNRFFDVVTIQKMGAILLLDGLANLLSVTVGLAVLAFYHPFLLVFDVGLLLAILLVFWLPARRGVSTAIQESGAKYAVQGWLEEMARNSLAFKTAGSENFARRRSLEVAGDYISARRTHYRIVFGQITAALGLQVVASTAVLGLGGWLTVKGELSLGQLVAAELLVVLVVQSVSKLGKLAEKYYDLMAAVDKVGKLIDLPVEDFATRAPAEDAEGAAELEVADLVLPGEPSVTAPVSFSLRRGEVLGIGGVHGVGKSLMLEVFFKLRRPASGLLRLDGRHFDDWSLCDFRRHVSLAADAEILDASVQDNVALGRPEVTVDDVQTALQMVDLLEDVHRLPQGLSTEVRHRGGPLSSGQRSRLILARALVGGPRLLLIDGLLDDLSTSRQGAVFRALTGDRSGRSVVIASSRPDVLAQCDRVVTLVGLRASGVEESRP